jgi:hyperosmotically inducible periplasmic protein
MRKPSILGLALAAGLLSGCERNSDTGASGSASESQHESITRGSGSAKSPDQYDANNTGRNARDRSDNTLTPEDQGGSDADREISRQIRRAIVANDQLSADAKNIKVITQNGKVTLRGPVDSAQEQQTVAGLAKGVSGVASVDNQLELKSKQ